MNALPPELFSRLYRVLANCGPFTSDSALRAVFSDIRISLWHNKLPQANSPDERVKITIDYLRERYNATQENALVLFIRVLSEQVDSGDTCHQDLLQLAIELEQRMSSKQLGNVSSHTKTKGIYPTVFSLIRRHGWQCAIVGGGIVLIIGFIILTKPTSSIPELPLTSMPSPSSQSWATATLSATASVLLTPSTFTSTPAPTNTPAPTPTFTLIPPTPTPTPDPRLFFDDFELGIKPEWGASGSGFASSNGQLFVAEDGVWETSTITIDASNYKIVFDGLPTSGDMDKLRFRFRVQNKDNYMLLEATKCWVGRWTHCWEWYKVVDGQAQVIPGTRFEGKRAVSLTAVEIEGNVYRTFMDYEQKNYFVDETFSTGGIQFQFKGVVELEGIQVLRVP